MMSWMIPIALVWRCVGSFSLTLTSKAELEESLEYGPFSHQMPICEYIHITTGGEHWHSRLNWTNYWTESTYLLQVLSKYLEG